MANKPPVVFRNLREELGRLILARVAFLLALLLACLNAPAVLPPATTTITFDSQTGPYGSLYSGHTEGPFTVKTNVGVWYQSMQYGNPVPSVYTGPPGTVQRSVLQITSGSGTFLFGSLDFSSNNGTSIYSIQGFLGAQQKFDQPGIMLNSPVLGFSTLWSSYSTPIDALLIDVTPGAGTTSLNLDNIVLTLVPIPEPRLVSLLALLLGAFRFRRNRP